MSQNSNNPFSVKDFSSDASLLADQGKIDALAGQPSRGSHTPPRLFLDYRGRLKSTYDLGVADCQDELQEIEGTVDTLTSVFEDSNLRSRSSTLIQQSVLKLNVSVHKLQIDFFKSEFEARKKDLERFKIQHELTFQPERGTSEHNILGISVAIWVMISLYITEATLNAALFMNELGPVGGYAVSLSSSLVNVVLGFLVGRYIFPRIIKYRNFMDVIVSGLLFLGFIWTIIYMNLMIALYRSLVVLNANFAENVPALSSAGWPFPYVSYLDFESSLILMVGLVFALISLIDGYFSDDPFPGYGHKYRLCIKARDSVQRELKAYKAEMIKTTGSTVENIKSIFDEARLSINEWGGLINTVQRRFVDYIDWISQLTKGQDYLWDSYCSSHQRHRLSDYKVSEVFDSPPEMFVSGANYHDPSHVFSDVSFLYMNDKARTDRMKSYESSFKKIHAEAEKQLEKEIDLLKKELNKIEKVAECIL